MVKMSSGFERVSRVFPMETWEEVWEMRQIISKLKVMKQVGMNQDIC